MLNIVLCDFITWISELNVFPLWKSINCLVVFNMLRQVAVHLILQWPCFRTASLELPHSLPVNIAVLLSIPISHKVSPQTIWHHDIGRGSFGCCRLQGSIGLGSGKFGGCISSLGLYLLGAVCWGLIFSELCWIWIFCAIGLDVLAFGPHAPWVPIIFSWESLVSLLVTISFLWFD